MKGAGRFAAGLALLVLGVPAAAQPVRDSEDWADSPEAYFLTAEERSEWKGLGDREARGAFRERYWLKRDPTAGTERNEFREVVLARIAEADKRFPIEKTPGSRTARGFVFIVFGNPSRVRDTHAAQPEAPRNPAASGQVGRSPGAVGVYEGSETFYQWVYDRERTPRILEALELPSLEIELAVEPGRRSDAVQNPGLVNDLRERLARKTIVNPDLIPPAAEPAGASAAAPLPRAVLDPGLKSFLAEAPFVSRSGSFVFGDAVLWRETGGAETHIWFHLPPPSPKAQKRFLHGVVRKEGAGEEVASLSEPVVASPAFSAADPGETFLLRLPLPPGVYEAAFAVTEGSAARPVASAAAKLSVPDLEAGFAVSSLVLTRGAGTRDPADHSPFAIGSALVPPRADATFASSESLWFFLELAGVADPPRVSLEVRLRRGAEPMRTQPAMAAQPQAFAAGRYLCGFELPLSGLEPGDYRLYVLVRDGVAPPEKPVVRAADFRLRP